MAEVMTDRELLELAAKAVGIELVPCTCSQGVFKAITRREYPTHWDPLADDGDALRLAVKLSLHICIDAEGSGSITVEWGFDRGGCAQHSVVEDSEDEPNDCAATRRAIVRAAAEIGKGV